MSLNSNTVYFKQRLFNTYMKKGKKMKSEKFFNNFLNYIKHNGYTNIQSFSDMEQLFYMTAPLVNIRQKKYGKYYKQIPFIMSSRLSLRYSIKLLIKELHLKKNKENSKNFLILLKNLQKKEGNVSVQLSHIKEIAVKNMQNYKLQW